MRAASSAGPALSSFASSDRPIAEPCLLDSVLEDIRDIRSGIGALVAEAGAPTTKPGRGRWSRFHADLIAVHRRTGKTLSAAATRDGVSGTALEPLPACPLILPATDAERVARCRRWARELEQHASSTLQLATQLGLVHLSHALGRCRCELIGLEQPMIALQASIHDEER